MHDRTSKQNPCGWILGIAVWALLAWSAMRPPAISNEPLRQDAADTDAVATTRPLARAHAHNDYRHKRPLLDALAEGFSSVEADIHLKDGKLLVGHDAVELRPDRTLQALYLDPLRARAKQNGGKIFADALAPLTLLVDIKTDGPATYRVLRDVLADYDDLLAGPVRERGRDAPQNGNPDNNSREPAVVVVVSGNRPRQAIEQDHDRRVGIDGRIGDLDADASADLLPLVSDNWRNHFRWQGKGPMPEAERARLRSFVAKAHAKGRRIRFWATPEREAFWKELSDAGVDLIGTDDLTRLATFLRQ